MKRTLMQAFSVLALLCLALTAPALARANSTSSAASLKFNAPTSGLQNTGGEEAARIATREKLRQLLERTGPTINVSFKLSQKQPFNFIGVMTQGLANAESLEIVIGVTAQNTINFRIYPHYKGGYINVDRAKNSAGLMRQLLLLTDRAFLFWGMDGSADVFAGYTLTLESGFPDDAIIIVLRSIRNLDRFVGELKPAIDATPATPTPPKTD